MSRVLLAISFICASMLILADNNRAVVAKEELVSKLPAKLVTRHQQFPDCLKLNDPSMPPEGAAFHARLSPDTELYGILCESSAYNWPYAVYIVRDGETADAERMFFADYSNDIGWTGTNLLFNASYDEKTRTLRGFSKARGLGDCGSLTTLKWNGEEFTLMEFRYKEECDEDVEKAFPLVYKRGYGRLPRRR